MMGRGPSTGPKGEDWAAIPPSKIVRRFFPEASKYKTNMDGIIPGRSWPAWNLPKSNRTGFDAAIAELIEGNNGWKMQDATCLNKKNIACPFHFWRQCAVLAIFESNQSFANLSTRRFKSIESEIKIWNNRINISGSILRSNLEIREYIGSVNLNDFEDGSHESRNFKEKVRERIQEIRLEISKDREVVCGLNKELARITRITEGKKGSKAPNLWYTPFYMNIGNAWKHTTGSDVWDRNPTILNILNNAVSVAIGKDFAEKFDYPKWGLAEGLVDRFRNAPSGQGFRLGEAGWFDSKFAWRGKELRQMIDYMFKYQGMEHSISGMFEAAITLIDYCPGFLSSVMRNFIIKECLANIIVPFDKIAIQLGWPVESEAEVHRSLVKAISAAKRNRNIPAAVVVQTAFSIKGKAREIIADEGWEIPFSGIPSSEIMQYYTDKISSVCLGHDISSDGDFYALKAAMDIHKIYLSDPQAIYPVSIGSGISPGSLN